MRRLIGLLICLLGAALPWRLRVLLSEALGWFAQTYHLVFASLLRFILRNLQDEEGWERAQKKLERKDGSGDDPG